MVIYYILILCWLVMLVFSREMERRYTNFNSKLFQAISMGILLFLVMGLKHPSVGVDTAQYLYRYHYVPYPLDSDIFAYPEWVFYGFSTILSKIGIGDQGYLAIYALIISASFSRFFYKYSTDIFLSFYLHLTIGLFDLSLSGMRQMFAICIILLSFDFLMKNKLVPFVISVIIAYFTHNSAICFLPFYFLKNINIDQKKGTILLLLTALPLAISFPFESIIKFLAPERFLIKYNVYETLSHQSPINPLLIVISLAIPAACILFWKYNKWSIENAGRIMSILFIMSLMNAFTNVLSINLNMVRRLSFYFVPFIMVLIPIIISNLKIRSNKVLAILCCIIFPLYQFIVGNIDGTLSIEDYKFFWQ